MQAAHVLHNVIKLRMAATLQTLSAQCAVADWHNRMVMPCTASQVVPPVKTADFKLTVSTNREAVQVLELFGDLFRQVGW